MSGLQRHASPRRADPKRVQHTVRQPVGAASYRGTRLTHSQTNGSLTRKHPRQKGASLISERGESLTRPTTFSFERRVGRRLSRFIPRTFRHRRRARYAQPFTALQIVVGTFRCVSPGRGRRELRGGYLQHIRMKSCIQLADHAVQVSAGGGPRNGSRSSTVWLPTYRLGDIQPRMFRAHTSM